MLAGKWVGEIFEKKKSEDHEYLTYFFTCRTSAEKLCDMLRDFFSKVAKEVVYTDVEGGKFNIKLLFSFIENISITLKVYRVSNEKYIMSLVFNEGNKTTFFKMMKDFIQDNEKLINLI
jgi:hypothetical protein